MRLPLFVFLSRHPTASFKTRREAFFFRSIASGETVGRALRARRRERNEENMQLKMTLLMMYGIALAALPLAAETEIVGDYTWTYRINGDTAEILGISPSTGAVTIPSTLGGKPVTSIRNYAFH